MKRFHKMFAGGLLASALIGLVPSAQASFVGYICNDKNCDGVGDMAVDT